jgi:hypothetical protein
VVGEPRQREVLDLLGVGTRCDDIEFIEPGLLLAGAPYSLLCQVGFRPWMQEGAGELDQSACRVVAVGDRGAQCWPGHAESRQDRGH